MYRVLSLLLSIFFFVEAVAQSPNTIFVGSREGDPDSLVKNVSTIHGDYSELEVDLCVSGPDPLILSRFYTSKDRLDSATFGGWRFQPQTFFLICPNPDRSGYQTPQGSFECLDIYVGMPEGSLLKFSGFQNWENPEVRSKFFVDLEEDEVGVCNIAKGTPSSWTNTKNHVLSFDPKSKSFELQLSSGGKRIYVQGSSPGHFLLSTEVLPSGNQITYEYDQSHRIKQIKMTGTSRSKLISWVTLEYGSSITATASDGTTAQYYFEKDASETQLLSEVKCSSLPARSYRYQVENAKALLTRKELPNGRYTEIDYERASPYRVATLSEPLQEGEVSTTSFTYGKSVTEVHGPPDQKTLYYYDDENRLIAVEETLDNAPYRIRKKQWGGRKDQGNLVSLSIEDASENTLYCKTFSYDQEGNILEENEYGNLTGQSPEPIISNRKGMPESNHECLSKKYSYKKTANEDIVSQINEQGHGTLLAYMQGTAILKRKEIHQNKVAKRRIFYDYNEDGSLVRVTTDNGNTRDINDPDYVPQKSITAITPKQEFPNMGAPEVVEERAYDPKSKSEILLKKTVNHFDARGLIIKQDIYDEEDTYLYSLEKSYDSAGRLTSLKDSTGNQLTYRYDTSGNLIQEETLDLTIGYDYDLQNNLIEVVRNGENCPVQQTVFAFDAMGNKIEEIDALGNRTEFHFDSLGRLIKKTTSKTECTAENVTWAYSYNLFDHRVTITDPLNNTTVIEYTTRGKPTYITSDGKEESFVYSLEGSLYRHILPQGIRKTFEYDYLGRTSKVNYYERESKEKYKTDSYYYDAFHLLSESTSTGKIKYIYNSKGQLTQSIFAQNDSSVWWSNGISKIENGEITDFAYDAGGRLIETKKWKDKTHYTLYAQKYDLWGRVIEERIEDEQGKLLYKKKFTYTLSGQLLSEIGFPNNQETILAEYSYDPLQRLSQVKRGNSIWDITHEENQGAVKKTIRDPLGSITEESYNSAGLLRSCIQKDPNYSPLLDERFTYDSLNNLAQEKTSNFEISYVHTPSALCQSIALIHNTPGSFWKASEKQETLQHSFTYNSYGELTHSGVPSFEKDVEYIYDTQGNLSRITYQETPNGQAKRYTLTSDKKGNTTKVVQDNGFTLEKTYNTHGRILTEKMKDKWGFYGISFKYDGEGCLTQITLPDQSSIHYIYEGPFVSKIRRLSKENEELYTYEVTDRDLMGNVLQERLPKNLGVRRNTYDLQGRKVEITSDFFSDRVTFDSLGNPIKGITQQGKEETEKLFTYDYLSQLIAEDGHSYRYDSLQNLVLKDRVSYTITPYNQVAKGGDFTCEYDACGNLKSLSDSSGTRGLQFDALGRLILAQTPEGKPIHYTYDSDLRRMSKSIDSDNTERYFYLGGYELGAIDQHGNIKALRIPINPNALESTSILSIELENEIYIPFSDLQRNIRCLVHPQRRTIVESYKFSAFGEEQIFTSRRQVAESQLNNPWRFQGKRHDNETGLIYYGARYYSPKLHTWISPDPIGSHDSLNLYLFCHNNPLKYHDPWGLAASIAEDCECVNHDHPGYNNRPSGCVCICGQGGLGVKMSGVVVTAADFAVDTWNNPRFQGGLQAFTGLAEASAGGLATLGSGGLAAPVGWPVFVHGLDQFITGMSTAITGKHGATLTEQLLQTMGMSSEWASFTNDILTIGGTMGGSAIIRKSRYINQTLVLVATNSGGSTSSYNRVAFERYKTLLRAQMAKPYVVDPELNKYVNRNYRPNASIGRGSTAAAIRYELATGNKVFNKLHLQKGREMINVFEKWLRNNPTARPGDRAAAENIIKDLRNALGE
jgi:RHS repeat-associated protein